MSVKKGENRGPGYSIKLSEIWGLCRPWNKEQWEERNAKGQVIDVFIIQIVVMISQ